MALQLSVLSHLNDKGETYEPCDACLKPGTKEKPLVMFYASGRNRHDRAVINIHTDCLRKRLAKIDKELDTLWQERAEGAA